MAGVGRLNGNGSGCKGVGGSLGIKGRWNWMAEQCDQTGPQLESPYGGCQPQRATQGYRAKHGLV